VNVGGLIKNMLDSGFSLQDCIGELIDDSIGAGATVIRLTLDSAHKECVVSDNGSGMTVAALGDSAVLNNRSEKPSNVKRGRFGIGRHTGCATLTGIQNSTVTLSKCKNDPEDFKGVSQLITNWPEIIAANAHNPAPGEITWSGMPQWMKYSIDSKKRGTVTINTCTDTVFAQLLEMIRTKDIAKSLVALLGRSNFECIERGLELTIVVDGVSERLRAFNPTPLHSIPTEDKETTVLKVHRHKTTKEYRAFFKAGDVDMWLQFNVLDKAGKKRIKKHLEGPGEDYDFCGDVTVTNVWSKGWDAIDLDIIGSEWMGGKKEGFSYEIREFLGGRFIKRDNKLIAHHTIPHLKAGDRKAANHYHDGTRQLVQFSAEQLDNEFGTMLNKGKVEERLIIGAIRESCAWLHYQFAQRLYKRDFPKGNVEVEAEAEADGDAGATEGGSAAAGEASAGAGGGTAGARPPAATQMAVAGHMRSTPKSKKEIMKRILDLADWLIGSDIETVIETVSATTEPGLAAVSKGIDGIYSFLEEAGVTFKD
jgi:hypothetical protein